MSLNKEDLSDAMEKSKHDLTAFAPVYEAYVDRIFTYCRHRVGSVQDAEDLTAKVFQRAMERCHSFRGKSVGAWLFKIAYHITIDHYRSRSPQALSDEVLLTLSDSKQSSPLETVIQNERLGMLQQWLDELEEDKRNLLLLRITGGLSAPEIAEITGKSAGAIRTEIHRIIQKLKENALQNQ